MNRAVLNKVLIVAVAALWILVGYRLVNRFFGKTEIPEYQLSLDTHMPENLLNRNSFQLEAIERDPFLGTYERPKEKTHFPIIANNTNKVGISKTIPWPSIEYYGFVKNENSSSPLLLFQINNKLHRIRIKENIDGLFVKEVYEDSVLLVNGSEKKVYKKK